MSPPTYEQLAVAINQLVTARDGEWAGVPMPLPGAGLVIEPRHPYADKIRELEQAIASDQAPTSVRVCRTDTLGWREVNRWHGRTLDGIPGDIVILRHEDGRVTWALDADAPKRNRMLLGPFDTFDAWNLDTECTAIDRLATLLIPRMFKAYVLTGGFLEQSKRSGVHYFFRRCRPTIAIRTGNPRRAYFHEDDEPSDEASILCTLCLHPIGYYRNTFGGAMTPTDDVIAHLLLMRGDEHLFLAAREPASRDRPGEWPVTIAARYFDLCDLEHTLDDAVLRAFGADPDRVETWPCGHLVYDPYDTSFEIWNTRDDFQATESQLRAVFALGFARGWICFKDGSEIYVGADGTRGARRPSVVPRGSDEKYTVAKLRAENAALRAEIARVSWLKNRT